MIKNLLKIENNGRFYFYFNLILRIILILAFAASFWEQNWLNVFLSFLTFILTFIPSFIQSRHKINLPEEIQVLIVLFLYAGIFLRGVQEFYYKFWWWSYLLHALSGLGLGLAGFLILYSLHQSGKLAVSPFLIVLFSFSFALTMGILWEIFEFGMDSFFGFNMQKARNLEEAYGYFETRFGLLDTMWDLILDALGALAAAAAGFLYLKKKEVFLFDKLVEKFKKNNPGLFKRG